jgi:hypothetical protein
MEIARIKHLAAFFPPFDLLLQEIKAPWIFNSECVRLSCFVNSALTDYPRMIDMGVSPELEAPKFSLILILP